MSITLACAADVGDDIGTAVRRMVALANRLGVGLHCDMNGALVIVEPGDCAETLLDYWAEVRHTGGVVRVSAAKARMS